MIPNPLILTEPLRLLSQTPPLEGEACYVPLFGAISEIKLDEMNQAEVSRFPSPILGLSLKW